MTMMMTMVLIVVGALETVSKSLEKTGGTGNQKNQYHSDYRITKIG